MLRAEQGAGCRPQDLVTKVRQLGTLGYGLERVFRVSQNDGEAEWAFRRLL